MPKKINVNSLKLAYSDGRKVNQDEVRRFVKKLEAIAKKTGGASAEDFLSIMIKENSLDENNALVLDQWSDKPTNKTGGHARGLIQFVPSTAKGVGLDQDKLSKMTATEQLDYVEKYFSDLPGGLKKITGYKDVYLSTFHPAAIGKGDDYVISSVALDKADDSTAYDSNKGIDIGEDGVITNADFAEYAQKNLPTDNADLFQEVSQEEYDLGYPNPDKPSFTEMNKELDSGKFQTSYTTPEGEKKTFTTLSPVKEVNILGDTYLQRTDEKGIQKSYRVKDDGSGISMAAVKNENISDNKYRELQKKSASGELLTSKEFAIAQSLYEGKDGDLETESAEQKPSEGYRENDPGYGLNKEGKNVLSIRKEREKLKADFYKQTIIPQIKKAKEIEFNDRKSKLEDLRTASTDFNKSASEIRKASAAYKDERGKFNTYKESYDKDIKSLDGYSDYNSPEGRDYTPVTGASVYASGGAGGKSIKRFGSGDFSKIDSFLDSANEVLIASEEAELQKTKLDLDTQLGGGDKKGGSSDQTITTPRLKDQDDNNVIDNPEDFTKKEIEKYSEFIDTDALQHQIDLDNTLLADLKSQKPIDDEVGEGDEDVLGNALGYGTDIARGIIGLSGATEKLPEYERGEAFNEYLGDARAFKAQGLTALEESVRKQRGERAYGFDVANIRNMGQGAGATLAAMGGAANRLQDRYAEVGLEDAAMKRQGRAEFARAALTDEQINRQQFEDKFKISMANKEAGAGLVRDAYTNLNERVAYNEAYGKGSQQYQYMNELTKSMKTNRELLKRSSENRTREGIRATEEAIKSNTDKLNKANKARNAKK